jgi:hypothetical protein
MSPVSRGRKGKKNTKSTRRPVLPDVFGAPDKCECPTCSGADFDPRRLIDELTASAAELVMSEDPLDAEIAGAAFVSIGEIAGEDFQELLVGGFIPEFEARATTEALAMLLAIGSVTEARAGKAASAAADRLVEAGIARPGWAAELGEPVAATDCWRLSDAQGTASMLACSFHRAGRSHAIVMSVDHLDCGAVDEIVLLSADQLPEVLEMMRADGRDRGLEITTEALDAAELRWQVEKALDARAVHDNDQPDLGLEDMPVDEDGLPDYPALAVLVRARMNALPVSGKPTAPHEDEDDYRVGLPKKSDRLAPVYQIKVGLRGAKPPIWRRLEVPADISLAQLHKVIQIAFDWDGSHMHVFETSYGEFGIADAELGHRAEAPVTLAQVAPEAKSKIRYTYDFGDDWEHDILVEKVLDRDEAASYPRCTGGQRATPPEDCGGIWGYHNLTDVLTDPTHPEHEDTLEWLGFHHATEFDPASFDAKTVTQALSRLR